MTIDFDRLEQEIQSLGKEVFEEIDSYSGSLIDPQFYTDKFMNWAMKDEELKVSLFRFVDVLPSLPTSASVIRHVQEYFQPLEKQIPAILRKGLGISPHSLTAKVVARTIRQQIRFVGQNFIVGETPEKALNSLRRIRKNGMAFTVDLVGESVVSEAEARIYIERYLELLGCLAKATNSWKESKPIIEGHRADMTPVNISVKLSALYSQAKPVSTEHAIQMFAQRLAEILHKAKKVGAFVNVDMEDSSLTTITLRAFQRTLEMPEFRDYDRCGIVLQTYLRRTKNDLEDLLSWVEKRGVPIGLRLVKGAYWDTETILGLQRNWPIPVWQVKSCSDAMYEAITLRLLQNKLIIPAFASHNVRSLVFAAKAAELLGLEPTDFELQTLYGMGDPIKASFVKRGYLVREYAPIGKLIPAMGYLVRRLLENTSNEGFLKATLHDNESSEILLRKPDLDSSDTGTKHLGKNPKEQFFNCPLRDFSLSKHRESLREEIEQLAQQTRITPRQVHPIIGGKTCETNSLLDSVAPEDPSLCIAKVGLAETDLADEALETCASFFPTWRATPISERAEVLFRTAKVLQEKRNELTAAVVLEAGKAWAEADGDVAEAIDFLNYYAHEALRLSEIVRLGCDPGEQNSYFYEPRGTALIVSPWNFPAAIPCGMFSAALATGNCAILKPAGQSSYIAELLFNCFLEAGLPPEAAAFLPGKGSKIGTYLAAHKEVSTIAFTGSKEVGLSLIEQGGKYKHGAKHVQRVIAEMGGKNAVIIDDDAELDEAVKGVVFSAFGYQGQKCSACSRVVVVGKNYERFLERLREAVASLYVGPASDPRTMVGPVIDAKAYQKIRGIIDEARSECSVVGEGVISPAAPSGGYYIPPIVFAEIPENHRILREEIFGPVLAVKQVEDFDAALSFANDSEYGLTGGVFSRSPANIKKAVREFRVGNLYINRKCTGALVYKQPFGGANLSGVGSKAGGPDYLLQFMVPRTVTENTMRRGFAPM